MRWALLIVCVSFAACHKEPTGVHLKQVDAALVAAGFKIDDFKSTDSSHFSAQQCVAGSLNGVDAVICEFGSGEAAALGKKAGEAWVGQAVTGAVLAKGTDHSLPSADRSHSDPYGKAIHKITSSYSAVR